MMAGRSPLRGDSEPTGRCHGDHGSLIVELALVLPLLAVLVLGIFEFGMMYRERSNLSGALRSAVRIDTTNGSARQADYLALQSFYAQMAQAQNITVNKVVIYKTTSSAGDPLDPSCFTSSSPAPAFQCSVYTWAQITNPGANYLTNFGPTDLICSSSWDANFCPVTRNDQQSDPPDYVGVYANVTYKSMTGLMPNTVTLTDKSVARIDPKVSS